MATNIDELKSQRVVVEDSKGKGNDVQRNRSRNGSCKHCEQGNGGNGN